jgi:hypothetical protein
LIRESHSLFSGMETNPDGRLNNLRVDTFPVGTAKICDTDIGFTYALWSWRGRLHSVPENWIFPTLTVSALWDLWIDGMPGQFIRPFRFFKSSDCGTPKCVGRLSKARNTMEYVLGKCGKQIVELKAMGKKERDELFAATYLKICKEFNPHEEDAFSRNPKLQAWSYVTFYENTLHASNRPTRTVRTRRIASSGRLQPSSRKRKS